MPGHRYLIAGIVVLASLLGHLQAQVAMKWQDPSPHKVRFVSGDDNVSLEVLDWGGSGNQLCYLQAAGIPRMYLTILRPS